VRPTKRHLSDFNQISTKLVELLPNRRLLITLRRRCGRLGKELPLQSGNFTLERGDNALVVTLPYRLIKNIDVRTKSERSTWRKRYAVSVPVRTCR
jgi:hypothetical protein